MHRTRFDLLALAVTAALDLHLDLPLDTDGAVEVTVPPQGSLAFTCGMGMLRGSVVAR
jgi:plastocyanin domain-containing protein